MHRCMDRRGGVVNERGQVAVLAAVLMALMMGIVIAVAMVGQAAIERSNATIAADALALTSVGDSAAHQQAVMWYQNRGFAVDASTGRASITGDQATARSHATTDTALRVAPAVVAVLARAGQLVAHEFRPVHADGLTFVLAESDARVFDAVAAELGACRGAGVDGAMQYQLC